MQELYEKKLVTYPRTDARVLSTAVTKEIHKNIGGLKNIPSVKAFAEEILESGTYKKIGKSRYVNDKQITDHYAIIPTGQGFSAIAALNKTALHVYETIVRRFLGIFFPPAVYRKINLVTSMKTAGPQEYAAGSQEHAADVPKGGAKESAEKAEKFFASFKDRKSVV